MKKIILILITILFTSSVYADHGEKKYTKKLFFMILLKNLIQERLYD